MSIENRVSVLEEQANNPTELETIIPKFQTPPTCVFCTDKDYDSIFYLVFRAAYHQKTGKDPGKQDKERCVHHSDQWLKHSLRSAGFIWSALTDAGKNSITSDKVMEIFKDKPKREELLTKEYDVSKKYTCAIDLYLPKSSNINTEKRYHEVFDIDDDVQLQNSIIQNKIKIYYNKAIEVLRNFDSEEEVVE